MTKRNLNSFEVIPDLTNERLKDEYFSSSKIWGQLYRTEEGSAEEQMENKYMNAISAEQRRRKDRRTNMIAIIFMVVLVVWGVAIDW